MCVYIYIHNHIGKKKNHTNDCGYTNTGKKKNHTNDRILQSKKNDTDLFFFLNNYKNLIYFLSIMVLMYTLILEMV